MLGNFSDIIAKKLIIYINLLHKNSFIYLQIYGALFNNTINI